MAFGIDDFLMLAMSAAGSGAGQKKQDTNTVSPWEPQQGYLKDVFSKAQGLYGMGTSPLATQLWGAGVNRSMAPGGLLPQTQQMLSDTMAGKYMDPAYLDQQFGNAADQVSKAYLRTTMPSTSSAFETAGRFGSGAHQNRMRANEESLAMGLSNMATNLYGGAYQAERGRQMSAAPIAPTMATADINSALGFALAPNMQQWNQLQNYMNMVGGANWGKNQPVYSNPLMGGIGGAITGYQLGQQLFGDSGGGFSNPAIFSGGGGGGYVGGMGWEYQ